MTPPAEGWNDFLTLIQHGITKTVGPSSSVPLGRFLCKGTLSTSLEFHPVVVGLGLGLARIGMVTALYRILVRFLFRCRMEPVQGCRDPQQECYTKRRLYPPGS